MFYDCDIIMNIKHERGVLMELNEVIQKRKSIRKYKDEKVKHEDLVEIVNAGILAPSWKNFQTTRYYIAESSEMVNKVKACLAPFNQTNAENANALIVCSVVKDRAGFNKDGSTNNELGNEWGFYDCGLSNMNAILKATELGYGTLIMGIRDADMLRKTLAIPANEMIGAVIAVGIADIDPDRPIRKEVQDIASFR